MFQILLIMKVSGFTFGELTRLFQASSVQPERLTNPLSLMKEKLTYTDNKPERLEETSFPNVDYASLTLQNIDAFTGLTLSPIGLTLPFIPMPDDGVKFPVHQDTNQKKEVVLMG